ncbi:MAG: MFS transporter [Hyphomicrobiales bacterium]|nr:MFS transporter [Hyphomicrobiales bacterium]MBV8663728.1 MFS transporter [Hyphomicrobiales bacterium]
MRPKRPYDFGAYASRRPQQPQDATPGLAARLAAAQAVADVLASARPLEERSEAEGRAASLDARDRALARSIVTVSLRRLGTIRKALGRFLEKGLPKKAGALEWILTVGAAQLLFLDIPDHAAVDLAVRATRLDPGATPFAGLVNAVLRNLIRAKEEILDAADPLDDDTPLWLAGRWRATYGEETARAIARAHRDEPTLDLSVKSDPAGWAQRLGGVALPTGSVRLDTHAPVNELEGYGEGEWWVQDAAAALPARLLNAGGGQRVVDLCAAPGGKSAELAVAGAQVTAVDRSAERLKRLAANFERLRLEADIVVSNALTYEAAPFDATLLDAPCMATGTIRRHPDVAWIKRQGDLPALAELQGKLLDRAIALAKPGGTIVYCTCSLEPEEGEGQIAALLRRNPDVRRVPIDAAEIGGLSELLTPAGELRTLPCHLPGPTPRQSGLDGFFAARLQRKP